MEDLPWLHLHLLRQPSLAGNLMQNQFAVKCDKPKVPIIVKCESFPLE